MSEYFKKYNKYKNKYLELKYQFGGANEEEEKKAYIEMCNKQYYKMNPKFRIGYSDQDTISKVSLYLSEIIDNNMTILSLGSCDGMNEIILKHIFNNQGKNVEIICTDIMPMPLPKDVLKFDFKDPNVSKLDFKAAVEKYKNTNIILSFWPYFCDYKFNKSVEKHNGTYLIILTVHFDNDIISEYINNNNSKWELIHTKIFKSEHNEILTIYISKDKITNYETFFKKKCKELDDLKKTIFINLEKINELKTYNLDSNEKDSLLKDVEYEDILFKNGDVTAFIYYENYQLMFFNTTTKTTISESNNKALYDIWMSQYYEQIGVILNKYDILDILDILKDCTKFQNEIIQLFNYSFIDISNNPNIRLGIYDVIKETGWVSYLTNLNKTIIIIEKLLKDNSTN